MVENVPGQRLVWFEDSQNICHDNSLRPSRIIVSDDLKGHFSDVGKGNPRRRLPIG